MNDLEQDVRDTLLRHQGDAPLVEISDAPRVAGRAHRRQARNVVVGGIAGTAAVIFAIAGLAGLVRADRSPTVLDPPPPTVLDPPPTSQGCVATAEPIDAEVHGWPGPTRNPAGVYSWDKFPDAGVFAMGFMRNAHSPGTGHIAIVIEGETGQHFPVRVGDGTATVAGCEGIYRRRDAEDSRWRDLADGGQVEEWIVDIQGTTVAISLIAKPGAPEHEVAEAHEIIESIRAEPQHTPLGFRLLLTLRTNTWDSG